jgi:integrase
MPRKSRGPRLYLRNDARNAGWVIRDGPVQRRTGCSADDREGAESALAAYIARKYQPVSGESDLARIPIVDVLSHYLSEHAPHTANPEWLGYMATPLIDWWGDKTLAAIRGGACRAYTSYRAAHVSEATARHELSVLSAAIKFYHREHGPLSAVPTVTLPPKPAPRKRWLTRSEAARLLWAARRTEHVKRLILIGLRSGTRSGAILAMGWVPSTGGGHFDLGSQTLTRAADGELQSKKRKPPSRIHAKLLPWLRRWRERDIASGVSIVCHYDGVQVKKLRRSWATIRKAAGLGDDVTPHVLRHTCVTWLLQAGVPTWEVAGFVGMSEETVRAVYGHHSPDHQAKAVHSP